MDPTNELCLRWYLPATVISILSGLELCVCVSRGGEKETKISHKVLVCSTSQKPSTHVLIPGEPMQQRVLNDTVLDLEKNHLRTTVASDQKNGKTHTNTNA